MKRKLLVIGIGAGNPDYITVQAIDALNRADVFFIPDKGTEKAELARVRREICDHFIRERNYRTVEFDVPVRDKAASTYRGGVAEWHSAIAAIYRRMLAEEMSEDECGAFLVWGDPALYDSTIRILDALNASGGIEIAFEVIPGISSVQALAARHAIALNRIGEPVAITTGRKLAEGFPQSAGSVVVMLDGENSFMTVEEDVDIFWGAYLGTEDEILISGRLRDVAEEIALKRKEARQRKGWIMDTYLLRRTQND
jgi:precorrin-6A synthase